jgi:hypothetical protein
MGYKWMEGEGIHTRSRVREKNFGVLEGWRGGR